MWLIYFVFKGLHLKRIIKLHQPLNTLDPSSISIELSIEHLY